MNTLNSSRLGSFLFAVAIAAAAQAVPHYRLTDLGSLDGGATFGFSINNARQILVGSASFTHRDFLWNNGVRTAIPAGGDSWMSMNEAGVVAGSDPQPGNPPRAFRWDGSTLTYLPTDAGWAFSAATDLNNAHKIVGYGGSNGSTRAAVWQGSTLTLLPEILAGGEHIATAINDAGVIAGNYGPQGIFTDAFVYINGTYTLLGPASVNKINPSGRIVGDAYGGGTHAALWDAATGIRTDIFEMREGLGINAGGDIVGLGPGNGYIAYARIAGQVYDLNTLVDPSTPGWELGYAWDINDFGDIVGTGQINGQTRAFLATAVPEPATLCVFLPALLLLHKRRSKQGS